MIPCDHALNKVFSVHSLIRAAVNIRVEPFADFLHSNSQFFTLIKNHQIIRKSPLNKNCFVADFSVSSKIQNYNNNT